MRSNDDSPRPSTRPSLLTPAQQAEADRSRILSHLEGGRKPAPVPNEGKRSRLAAWGGMAAGALLLLATGAWLGQRETVAEEAPLLATTVPAPPAPAADTVSAAASIREEEQPARPQQSLSEMLGADLPVPVPVPAPVPVHGTRDVLSKALETPQKSAPKPARAPQKKPLAKPLKPAEPAKPAVTPEQESDVALLAALVSHGQAGTAPKKAPPPSLQAQLQQCSKLKPAAADSCRQRTCAGRTNKPQCKAAKAARTRGAQ